MTVLRGHIYVGEGIGIPIEMVQVDEYVYEVINLDTLIKAHDQKCRTFKEHTYPNFVDGIFQRAHYYGDCDSQACKWFQAILQGASNACILTEVRRWGSYVEFLYNDGFANVFIQMENNSSNQ